MAACKAKALKLLLGMISLAFLAALAGQPSVQVSVNIIGKDGNLINGALNFSSLGLCHGDWANLLQHSPGGCQTWEWLRKNMWLGRCISSDMAQASLDDIFFFLGWLMAHSGAKAKLGQKLAVDIAQQALPLLLLSAGQWMDQLGYMKSAEHLQALPVLRTKAGKLRKMMDPVNRMLLLWKLRKEKVQRRKAAVTHDDLVASETSWARKEALVDCVLHQNALLSFMKGHPKQVALSWDPSNYGGKEILVVMGYSKHLQSGFYALNQWLARMKLSDLDDSLIKTAREKKLERLEGYNEIRGLGKALESIDMHWNDFRVPAGLVLRPLMAHEYRVLRPETGRVWIYNEQTQAAVPEVPLDYYLGDIPALISISDQGPINWAALNYLMWSKQGHMLLCIRDPFHRAWNDCKNSAKKTTCKLWRTILELCLLFNLSYGPFGTSQFHYAERALLENFLSTETFAGRAWGKYQSLICMERKIAEPMRAEESMAMFGQLSALENFVNKGPLIKLMKWFSVFEGCCSWDGDFFATKLILESKMQDVGAEGDAVEVVPLEQEANQRHPKEDDRAQLNALKKRKGTWALAPGLVTEALIAKKDVLMSVGRAMWKMHADRARRLKTPGDVSQHYIKAAGEKQWAAELVEMVANSLWRDETLQHLLPRWCLHPEVLGWHVEFFTHLLEGRAMSLTAFYCLPPFKYAHLLSEVYGTAKTAHQLARADFAALLKAE
ncbi:unnamed protein product, partial [Symbiodinium pilosum]